ncbi:MAG: DNA mismatch repair protein MutS [Kiritimatiellia bacterium]|jgi:DNA mismatch repair protein MutS|nr:DNA mismatch repair protein MutS [Kiritimatiellia bacterium]MDP6809306.1 DNA mismatch repair protein MutS [Kiritimatiellia bacterium]MDP7023044.1 DNA mismatch repair protein MutS [Kiritimatiellia bacterium]
MAAKVTPMMRQYRRIKGELPDDVILLFRLGDFYELFYEDAQRAAPIMDIALTKRNGYPMCGVPHHALDGYLAKLVRAGCKAAVCEQVEDPATAKGVVRREVARIVTPGTATEDAVLESNRNHYLAGIYASGKQLGLAMLDLSTGLFWGTVVDRPATLNDTLRRYSPSECLVPEEQTGEEDISAALQHFPAEQITTCDEWTFDYEAANDFLVRHFGVTSLDGFGCENNPALVGAAGAVLYYVKQDLRRHVDHIRAFQVRHAGETMLLDEATCLNLDLIARRGGDTRATLLHALDVTRTAMGARKLREWMLRPLVNADAIRARHDVVAGLSDNRGLLHQIIETLADVRDVERLIARISAGGGNARDVLSLARSLEGIPAIKEALTGSDLPLLTAINAQLQAQPELVSHITEALVDEPPVTLKEGGILRDGFNAELDALRTAATQGRQWLAEYQAAEQERTGIKNLKVRHNKVFGYYIEISKAQLANVPGAYTRKQTLVNAERFITPELKEYEGKILGAHGRAVELEYELFVTVRDEAVQQTGPIQEAADLVATLDVLAALTDRALALGYTRPVMTTSHTLRLRESRHPVVEQMPEAERFVPNDALLDCEQNQIIIITGPNMAGKSTYIRQVALNVIMAQMGSFVPAEEAEIGVVDRIFTRVGASDDLARGRSTFMVEMQETANILNNATAASLIVLDEIGRGTSTFDGISIAWAVAEYLHNNPQVKAKTLFATHYHELTDLSLTMPGVKNYNVLVRERNDQIAFLRKIVHGGSDKSYGIQVARLAGMPQDVIGRAKEILANLEEGELAETGQPKIAKRRPRRSAADATDQLSLFGEA